MFYKLGLPQITCSAIIFVAVIYKLCFSVLFWTGNLNCLQCIVYHGIFKKFLLDRRLFLDVLNILPSFLNPCNYFLCWWTKVSVGMNRDKHGPCIVGSRIVFFCLRTIVQQDGWQSNTVVLSAKWGRELGGTQVIY